MGDKVLRLPEPVARQKFSRKYDTTPRLLEIETLQHPAAGNKVIRDTMSGNKVIGGKGVGDKMMRDKFMQDKGLGDK